MAGFINSICFESDQYVFDMKFEENAAHVEKDPNFNKGQFIVLSHRGPCAVCVSMKWLPAFTQQLTKCNISVSLVAEATGTNWCKGKGHPVQAALIAKCLEAAGIPGHDIVLVRIGQCCEVVLWRCEAILDSSCLLKTCGLEVAPLEHQPSFAEHYEGNMNDTAGSKMACDVRFDGVSSTGIPCYFSRGKHVKIFPTLGFYQLACWYANRVVNDPVGPFVAMVEANNLELSGSATVSEKPFPKKKVASVNFYEETVGSSPGIYTGTVVCYCHNFTCAGKHCLNTCEASK